MIDFSNIDYLKVGNAKQRMAFEVLSNNNILEVLKNFNPILVGTIPINIDIESSDLDIICEVNHIDEFKSLLIHHFGECEGFKLWENHFVEPAAMIASFLIEGVEIEVFGQNKATKEQNAYKHMIIENELLNKFGEEFRREIIKLKKQGYKTEPAFAKVLGLEGNPYTALLELNVSNSL